MKIANVVVLGGGSAGLIAALTFRRLMPQVEVRVIRSPDIGVIGVGEGTTPYFRSHFIDYLRLDPARFHAETQPTWKLGIRFLWGPRTEFFYTFSRQFDNRWADLPKSHGFYCRNGCENLDLHSALMSQEKTCARRMDGRPQFEYGVTALHIENEKLVRYLDGVCHELGAKFIDVTVSAVERDNARISALVLESGERIKADLFIDASGFRSALLGRAFEQRFVSYDHALFCDRAVIGGWPRTDEVIKPYTTAETMDAGWCWQIEHERFINRGYVFSSRFISDDEARSEFLRKNPKISGEPRLVKFCSGRYERLWCENVVGIGNAACFVEPLEATALAVIVFQARSLAEMLIESNLEPKPTTTALYNKIIGEVCDDVRDFLALHYRFNHRLKTPFWAACTRDTEIGMLKELVEFYHENGPTGLLRHLLPHPHNLFGLEGYLAMLVGQNVSYRSEHQPTPAEVAAWQKHCSDWALQASTGVGVAEALAALRNPAWQWS